MRARNSLYRAAALLHDHGTAALWRRYAADFFAHAPAHATLDRVPLTQWIAWHTSGRLRCPRAFGDAVRRGRAGDALVLRALCEVGAARAVVCVPRDGALVPVFACGAARARARWTLLMQTNARAPCYHALFPARWRHDEVVAYRPM